MKSAACPRPSLEELYRTHGPIVFRRARQILRDDATAWEVLQDLFASLIERPHQLDGVRSLTAWFYSATSHACLNRLRNASNRARLIELHVRPAERAVEPYAVDRVIAHDLLAALPDELATVAIHAFVDEMTHAEIAELVGCSRRHVGNLIERIRVHIRRHMRVDELSRPS